MKQFVVCKCTSDLQAYDNCVFFNPADVPQSATHVAINTHYYYAAAHDHNIEPGRVSMSSIARSYMQLALGERVTVEKFDPLETAGQDACLIDIVTIGVALLKRAARGVQFDAGKMADIFRRVHRGQVFAVGQPLVMENAGTNFRLTVHAIQNVNLDAIKAKGQAGAPRTKLLWGVLMEQSGIIFRTEEGEPGVSVVNQEAGLGEGQQAAIGLASSHPIVQPDFRFEDMGIGGLADEFGTIFRRAFASRIFPQSLIDKLGIQHVRGVLLHGPPGTGKTLMARQIGKMLNAHEPKIVNGPEILNKYVGQSEANVRDLFAEAESEYKLKGDASQLHIIIFDELDAICRQRGSRGDSTGVGDQVVNQLLSKLDGVEQLNNVLVVGMTNRLDLIDEALLRPGRLEVHLEISLPNEEGRLEIFKIHTQLMQKNQLMAPDVSLGELAALAKNYSGAEITGVVKSATSFAFNRHVKVGGGSDSTGAAVEGDLQNLKDMKVCRDDFVNAIREVPAAYGRSDEQLSACYPLGVIKFSESIDRILAEGQLVVNQVRTSNRPSPLACLLLHGPPGSGKTALAAWMAEHSNYPFVKLLSPDLLLGLSEAQRVHYIQNLFAESNRSPLSAIIIDNIERLLDYNPIGPRFYNAVMQALAVLMAKPPPSGHRLLIIATTSERPVLREMGMDDCFTFTVHVPCVYGVDQLERVIEEALADEERRQLRGQLLGALGSVTQTVNVPVKKALAFIDTAVQDEERPCDLFLRLLEPYTVSSEL